MRLRGWIAGLLVVGLLVSAQVVLAQEGDDDSPPVPNEVCLGCHEDTDETMIFGDGTERSVQVDVEAYLDSPHGTSPEGPNTCYSCHGDYATAHNTELLTTPREWRLALNAQLCESCHFYQADLQTDGMHEAALESGHPNAAVCIDCHGYHDTTAPNIPRSRISQTCGHCHVAIYEEYLVSAHGEALLDESNPDVPTCVDCHGVHNIEDPTTNLFRLRSPLLCAGCHADRELMGRYGVSTAVFDTYVADFHGTTITIFENQAPDAAVNEAVCYDCHGVHAIRRSDDPESSVMQENLLETCQRCHPDADANFPAAWLGHYSPTPGKYPIVYFVTVFYRILIPLTVGFFVVMIVLDIARRLIDRFTHRDQEPKPSEPGGSS
jgi:predicted CXXCH cytochrome family protein